MLLLGLFDTRLARCFVLTIFRVETFVDTRTWKPATNALVLCQCDAIAVEPIGFPASDQDSIALFDRYASFSEVRKEDAGR